MTIKLSVGRGPVTATKVENDSAEIVFYSHLITRQMLFLRCLNQENVDSNSTCIVFSFSHPKY